MDPIIIGLIGIVIFLVLLAAGVHIGVTLGFVGIVGSIAIYAKTAPFSNSVLMGLNLIVNATFSTATAWVFLVLPLFILMGFVASEAGIPEMAYSALAKWTGNSRGSLGIATVLGQTGFGVCTGSSIVACTVFAKVSAPQMIKYGYSKKFSYGLIAGTGSLGMIIPPSVLAIIYGLLSGESIGALFLAGIGPGLVLSVLFIVAILVISYVNPSLTPKIDIKFTRREKVKSLLDFIPIIIIAFVVVYGILAGIFTPTEAGAIGSIAVFFVGIATRKLRIKNFIPVLRATASSTGMVFIIFIMAKVFSRFLILSDLASFLIEFIGSLAISPIFIVMGFVFIYLLLGMFLDSISILTITVPLLMPIVRALHIDIIWFAMVSILAIECGLVTPPIGLNVYAVKGVAGENISLEDLFRGSIPFFFVMVICVAIVMIYPPIATWLPKLFAR